MIKPVLRRFLLTLAIGITLSIVGSEIGFRFQGNTTSRPPQTVQLVIPPGTSEQVSRGQSILPADMVFVVGDTLLVVNQDTVAHTLGPLYIPPGTSASLSLDQIGNLAYSCSFQPTNYFGIEIQAALTVGTRIEGYLIAGIPFGLLMGVYSLVLWPVKKKDQIDPGGS